jgi:hypothetical protein
MKKSLFILGFILFFINANAQKWALPSSTWVTGSAQTSFVVYTTQKVEGDTIIDGINCKRIGNSTPPIFTYESNDTVYFYLDGKFRSTYYFNATINDTVSFYNANYKNGLCSIDSIVYAVVDSIGSINVGNKFLKKFHCSIIADSSVLEWNDFNYTEFIGSNYIYPYLYCPNFFDQESKGICDYGDSTIQDFYVFKNNCVGVSIDELENQNNQISIFPNPASDFLNVQLDFNTESHILTIRNTMGQIVQEFTITQGENSLDISYLSSGIYFATLNKGIEQQTFKFIKE